jgi:hypothetical protein
VKKITLLPQTGLLIEGIGQINFGESREKLYQVIGKPDGEVTEKRVRYKNYGCFIDFKTSDNTFESIEFWNDGKENVVEVFIYDTEVLKKEAQPIKTMLQEKNNNEAAKDGWYINIDVLYSGGSQKIMLDYIEESRKEGLFEGAAKEQMLMDLEKAKYFTSFGIGCKGYCKDGLAELEKILNGSN